VLARRSGVPRIEQVLGRGRRVLPRPVPGLRLSGPMLARAPQIASLRAFQNATCSGSEHTLGRPCPRPTNPKNSPCLGCFRPMGLGAQCRLLRGWRSAGAIGWRRFRNRPCVSGANRMGCRRSLRASDTFGSLGRVISHRTSISFTRRQGCGRAAESADGQSCPPVVTRDPYGPTPREWT
jgi:hypothetical protein